MPIESNRIYRFLSEKPSLKIFTSAGEVVEFSPYYTTQDEIIASELRKLKNIYEVDVLEGATLLPLPGKMVLRDEGGRAKTITPIAEDDITTKKYVDDGLFEKSEREHLHAKDDVMGLDKVDNVADMDKPVSIATNVAIDTVKKIVEDIKDISPVYYLWEKEAINGELKTIIEQCFIETTDGVYTLLRKISAVLTSFGIAEEGVATNCAVSLKAAEFPTKPITVKGENIEWKNHEFLTSNVTDTPNFRIENGLGLTTQTDMSTMPPGMMISACVPLPHKLPFNLEIISYALKEPLQPPTNFNACLGEGALKLNWDKVTNAESYNLYCKYDGMDYYAPIGGGLIENLFTLSADDIENMAGFTLHFVIVAVISGIEGEQSEEISIKLPEGENA